MAGKGAPEGNQYAKKKNTGHKIGMYLSAEDLQLLRFVQEKHGQDTSDAACYDLARKAAKMGINMLLRPEYYEIATRKVVNALEFHQGDEELSNS